jgi:hypothetical protein
VTRRGAPPKSASALKNALYWADVNADSYVKFQSTGNVVGIDPMYD